MNRFSFLRTPVDVNPQPDLDDDQRRSPMNDDTLTETYCACLAQRRRLLPRFNTTPTESKELAMELALYQRPLSTSNKFSQPSRFENKPAKHGGLFDCSWNELLDQMTRSWLISACQSTFNRIFRYRSINFPDDVKLCYCLSSKFEYLVQVGRQSLPFQNYFLSFTLSNCQRV